MDPNNKRNGLYFIKDQYQKDIYFEYEDAYHYYNIDVNKIRIMKQNGNEYFIRYCDFNKTDIVPLQLKIKKCFYKIDTFKNKDRVMFIHADDKEFFEKNREIWNKITELIFINNKPNFIQTTLDDEFIEASVLKNTVFTDDIYND